MGKYVLGNCFSFGGEKEKEKWALQILSNWGGLETTIKKQDRLTNKNQRDNIKKPQILIF